MYFFFILVSVSFFSFLYFIYTSTLTLFIYNLVVSLSIAARLSFIDFPRHRYCLRFHSGVVITNGILDDSLGGGRGVVFPSLGQDTDVAALPARLQRRGTRHSGLLAVSDSARLSAGPTPAVVEFVAVATASSAVGRPRQRQQVRLAGPGRRPPQSVYGE